ncbi:hypothetical protein TNCV_887091 [Trichonephila clavipes]|uniref:Uncharacterized protein n=1 Tax=Trichonephila clavipes TaxID=2585209 RepID=A0A8X6R7V5_TRICX|nr:hypothetical protein TNCV_887091 [Trichonephila clavipes]
MGHFLKSRIYYDVTGLRYIVQPCLLFTSPAFSVALSSLPVPTCFSSVVARSFSLYRLSFDLLPGAGSCSLQRPKVQKPDIEIKRVPHRSRNATPTEITTDDEDMITYDVEEGELEQDPPNKFTIDDDPFILPKGYLRALTPSRYRNYRE